MQKFQCDNGLCAIENIALVRKCLAGVVGAKIEIIFDAKKIVLNCRLSSRRDFEDRDCGDSR